LFGLWLAARLGRHVGSLGGVIVGIPLFAFAAGMAAVVFVLLTQGAKRLEAMDAP